MNTNHVSKEQMSNNYIINSMAQNIVIIDRSGTIVQTNDQWDTFCEKNGGSQELCGLGVNYFDVCQKSYTNGDLEEMEYVMKNIQFILEGNKKVFSYEYPCHSDEEKRWFLMYVTPLRQTINSINGAIIVHLDITSKVLSKEQSKYEDRISGIGQVVSSIADEIRNPLTTLKGFWTLFNDHENHSLKAFSEIIHSEIEKIEAITDRFLAISDPINEKFETASVHELIENTLKLLDYNTNKYDVYIFHSHKVHLPIMKNQMVIALKNIFTNAFSSMPNGGKVTITSSIKDNILLMQFIDEGHGISPELLTKLGEPFYLLNEPSNGLGLTIVHQVVHKHNGNISIESDGKTGTTVTIELPLFECKSSKNATY